VLLECLSDNPTAVVTVADIAAMHAEVVVGKIRLEFLLK
jgi:hypothetical protein